MTGKKKIKPTLTKGVARVPVVMQLEALECGAASLTMLMAYYGKWVPLEEVRLACGVSRDGSNAKNLYLAAQHYGFNVKAIRFWIFVINGAVAGIAGLSYAVMSMRYLPTEYAGGEMVVIAAIVLGGTRLNGGVGSLRGCLLGTLLVTMVTNLKFLADARTIAGPPISMFSMASASVTFGLAMVSLKG